MTEHEHAEDQDRNHLFSGWPGAWCQHCGAEDQGEVCLAEHDYWSERFAEFCELEAQHAALGLPPPKASDLPPVPPCPEHTNRPCPLPGTWRFAPSMRPPG